MTQADYERLRKKRIRGKEKMDRAIENGCLSEYE